MFTLKYLSSAIYFIISVFLLISPVTSDLELVRNQAGDGLNYGNFQSYSNQKISSSENTLQTASVPSEGACILRCLEDEQCTSINSEKQTNGKVMCELLKTNLYLSSENFVNKPGWTHYSIKSPCDEKPCINGKCIPQYDTGGYKCKCDKPYHGVRCEKALPKSCKEAYDKNPSTPDGAKTLYDANAKERFQVYCFMQTITGCGQGPWTMVIKINGRLNNFLYGSSHWSTTTPHNEAGGKTGFDQHEAKMRTFSTTTASSLCVGMKSGSTLKWLKIPLSSPSTLHALIADGRYRGMTVGRSVWTSLLSGARLQPHCNREGFNSLGRVRLGLNANNENDCRTCDTWIGFGQGSISCGHRYNRNVNCYILIK